MRHAFGITTVCLLLGVAAATCSQGEGDRCQTDSDCESGLVCDKPPSATALTDGQCCREGDDCVTGGGDADADTDADTDADADADADADTDADTDADGDTDADADLPDAGDAGTPTDAGPDAAADAA